MESGQGLTGDQRAAPAPACRRVTTDSRLATPTMMAAASSMRVPTKPSAAPSFCRLTTGYSTTAVPIQARATMISRKAPTRAGVSGPGPTM